MENFLARAMQVSYLTEEQLNRIHAVENRCGQCIANWNIQDILKIPSIRDTWYIPDDAESQARHAARIRKELFSKEIVNPHAYPGDTDKESTHAMDWAIIQRGSTIMWEYSNSKGSSIKSKMKEIFE